MTSDEAARLTNLIVSTWPTGPRGHVWTHALRPLNYTPAAHAYRQLRDEDERPPAVARFIAMYRQHEARMAEPADPAVVPFVCASCNGTGLVDADDNHRHSPYCTRPTTHECYCHALEPCRCSRGQGDATRLLDTIHRANGRPVRQATTEPAPITEQLAL